MSVPWQILNGVWKFTITKVHCVMQCEKMMPNIEEVEDLEESIRSEFNSISNDFFGDTAIDQTQESNLI